jgi:hypothetical protein
LFSDKQRQSWQNIKAPDGLLEKTAEALESFEQTPKHSFKRVAFPLIAASLLLIFASVFFIQYSEQEAMFTVINIFARIVHIPRNTGRRTTKIRRYSENG